MSNVNQQYILKYWTMMIFLKVFMPGNLSRKFVVPFRKKKSQKSSHEKFNEKLIIV